MPNPQQLKERIYALNPDLKQFSIGATVRFLDSYVGKYVGNSPAGSWIFVNNFGARTIKPTKTINVEVIGHPITLNEIIYAMREQDGNQDSNIVKLCGGSISMWDYKKTFDQNIAENEELVAFLLNIIK